MSLVALRRLGEVVEGKKQAWVKQLSLLNEKALRSGWCTGHVGA